MRGDNFRWKFCGYLVNGSHPHAWGQWGHKPLGVAFNRFTPTCVGTMRCYLGHQRLYPVHPHMRGDNLLLSACHQTCDGSPPHAWGQCCRTSVASCGYGSPPHAWGQLTFRIFITKRPRFTPTCVGTILAAQKKCPKATVHPHMRGDNVLMQIGAFVGLGSPPHAWGQYQNGHHRKHQPRFTPTCVGTM